MTFKSRKLYVWLISAGAIFVIFLLYNLISRTPPIQIDTGETVTESNNVEFDSKIGKVGDVGVGTIQKAKYTHLNAQKQIDREFGFEKLLHAEGNEWEIEKPYMNIFRGNLKFLMTADEGKVQVEDAVGRATPKDATLTGNVKIHILPEKGSNIEEGFIYLNDVIFISEKSQFSTAGPVKFISANAQMFGRGMEAVYNDELDRLDYLKVIKLESLRIRQPSKAHLFSSQPSNTTGPGKQAQTDQQKAKETPTAERKTIEKENGKYYKCVFRKNVIIDSPEQLILTDEVSINDILWPKGSDENSESREAGSTDKIKTDAEAAEESVTSHQGEPNEPSEKFVDIVVTCDDGIVVIPMDCPGIPENE